MACIVKDKNVGKAMIRKLGELEMKLFILQRNQENARSLGNEVEKQKIEKRGRINFLSIFARSFENFANHNKSRQRN